MGVCFVIISPNDGLTSAIALCYTGMVQSILLIIDWAVALHNYEDYMRSFYQWLINIQTDDEDTRRRGYNVVVMSLGTILLTFLFVPLDVMRANMTFQLFLIRFVPMLINVGLLLMVRKGHVTSGALLTVLLIALAALANMLDTRDTTVTPLFLVLPLVYASLSVRPRMIWLVFLGLVGLLVLALLVVSTKPLQTEQGVIDLFIQIFFLLIISLVSFLGALTTSKAIREADENRVLAESSAKTLNTLNSGLETTIAQRTAELQQSLTETQRSKDELSHTLETLRSTQATIRELSAPVVPILPNVIVAPIIGELDSERADTLMNNILSSIQAKQIKTIILDVTGVPIIDTHVAKVLLQTAEAAQLLGTKTMLVGIRPEVAQTLVSLNVDFGRMQVFADLQQAVLSLLHQTAKGQPSIKAQQPMLIRSS